MYFPHRTSTKWFNIWQGYGKPVSLLLMSPSVAVSICCCDVIAILVSTIVTTLQFVDQSLCKKFYLGI
jgi:hypothetical protein